MMTTPFMIYVLAMLLLLFTQCQAGFLQSKVHLRITNELGISGGDLLLHCKSKQDDLGQHILPFEGFFEFHFRPDIMMDTQYYCYFQWQHGAYHWFDIYMTFRDENRCDKQCWWIIKPDGPCLIDRQTGAYDLCAPWNKS